MNREDYCRGIIESDLYQDMVKKHSEKTFSKDMQINYLEGIRDGMTLAIKAFTGEIRTGE